MKKFTKKLLSCMMMLMMIGLCGNYDFNTASADESATKHNIWVIGDSTVSAFNDNYYYPRYGYGTQIAEYIDSNSYEVKNLALSGRSSKSYVLDPEYKTLLDGMSEGDFLIIGFGHNDEKTEEERYTNPNGTYEDEGSFANSLYENYIKYAEEKGCSTILCTPIVRRTADGVWTNSLLHITADTGSYEGGDYPQAIRDLGCDLDIPVVDMTAMTKELYDELGPDGTLYLHAWTSSKPASVDNTHTNIWGGKYNAYLVTKTIKELGIENLSEAVLADKIAKAPTKEDNLHSNPDYSEPEYDPNLKQSEKWEDAGIWKGSAFGNIGATPDEIGFTLTAQDVVNVNMAVRNNKGKIASAGDGIAMYYYKVPSKSNFTLSATATINAITSNNQVSFGLMARDDMYIDSVIPTLTSDYVAAGPLYIAGASPWNCFARKSGVLTQGGTVANTKFEAGQSMDLKIQSNSDGYACTMGDEKTITGGFDFALTSVDPDYVYVGMFVARNVDITFSNIKLIVDGKEVIAEETPVDPSEPVEPGEEETDKPLIDTGVLEKSIKEAETAAANIKVSEDGKDISKASQWVTKETIDALNQAINIAKEAKENAALQEDVENAAAELNKSLEEFNAQVKYGTKKSSSSHNHSSGGAADKDPSDAVIDSNSNSEEVSDNEISKPDAHVSGWFESEGKWFVKNADGSLKKGWYQDKDKNWYMFNKADGSMITGWFKDDDGKYYYLNPVSNGYLGTMRTGWIKGENSKWYYLNPISNGFKGSMLNGWINSNNTWYYLDSDGSMVCNAEIEGYHLGADGALVY